MTMKSLDKHLLILNDGRVGNYKQLFAVASHLQTEFEIHEIKLKFNFWSKLPNIFHVFDSISLKNTKELTELEFSPDLILSCVKYCITISPLMANMFPPTKYLSTLLNCIPNSAIISFSCTIVNANAFKWPFLKE